MAVVRQRQSPPYALIIMIVLFAGALAFAIWAFVTNGHTQTTVTNQQAELNNLVHSSEQSTAADLVRAGSKFNRSALGQAIYEMQQLQGKLAGEQYAKGTFDQAMTAADSAVQAATGDSKMSMTDAVKQIGNQNHDLKNQNTNLEQQLQQATTAYDAAKKQFDTQIASAQSSINDMQNDMKGLNDQLQQVRDALNSSVAKSEAEKTDLQNKLSQAQRDLVVKLRQAQDELAAARTQVGSLKEQVNKLRPNQGELSALQSDGRIIRADAVRGDVWINLGKKDRILPGLTFAVYDPRLGVGSGPDGAGMGSIEVVNVGETESFARVTHLTKNQYVVAGDLIANPVYSNDRTKTYHFVVVGLFDLNRDGQATAAERDRILNMIKNYGGVVDDKVTSQADYVIAGAPPLAGGAESYNMLSDEAKALLADRKQAEENYEAAIQSAKDLSIPVFNANRFLAMLGYFNTAVAAR